MRLEELMIGDFVYSFGKITKVTAKDLADEEIYSKFEPVPIVDHIVDGWGGFKKEYYESWRLYQEDVKSITIRNLSELKGRFKESYLLTIINDKFNVVAECSYVHEVQNILRICGEEREFRWKVEAL